MKNRWYSLFLAWWWSKNERGSMRNDGYAFHRWHPAPCSPFCWLAIDPFALDRVTHSVQGRSSTDTCVTWGWATFFFFFFPRHTQVNVPFCHTMPSNLQTEQLAFSANYLLTVVSSRKACSQAPPCSLLSFFFFFLNAAANPAPVMAEAACTLAFIKQPWHVTLPDSKENTQKYTHGHTQGARRWGNTVDHLGKVSSVCIKVRF